MSVFITDRHIPLFFDFTDGYPTSIDTGKPIYQCSCNIPFREFKETTAWCNTCDQLPKRVYMDLFSGTLVLVDASIV